MADRAALAAAFLAAAGWGDAVRRPLAGDASARRYERLEGPRGRAVLMDSPPGGGAGGGAGGEAGGGAAGAADDPAAFVRIAAHLRGLGLSPPQVLAEAAASGFLLLEDLGDDLYARVLARAPERETTLYAAAAEVLAAVQAAPPPAGLPDLSAADWAEAAALALDAYAAGCGAPPGPAARAGFTARLADLLQRHADGPRVLILRDFHAENLLWLPARRGPARVGLLDFQQAQLGQPGYDLASLIADARRDVSPAAAAAATLRFATRTGRAMAALAPALAVLTAQRCLRILGVFARLATVQGKAGYLGLLPRVWGQLAGALAQPALAPLRRPAARLLPAPTPANLERLRQRCPTP
jgi:hypothetical protein